MNRYSSSIENCHIYIRKLEDSNFCFTVWKFLIGLYELQSFCSSLAYFPHWKSPNSPRLKKARQVKSKVKRMLINFFDIKEVVHKEFLCQATQSILHTTVMFYSNCVKMWEDFALNFGNKRTGCCITTTHLLTLLFSPNITAIPHPL
jgi:hypothetical protein